MNPSAVLTHCFKELVNDNVISMYLFPYVRVRARKRLKILKKSG